MPEAEALKIMDVIAGVTPEGKVRRVNVLRHKTFYTVYKFFGRHEQWRWVIVQCRGEQQISVLDLWSTQTSNDPPYVTPTYLGIAYDTAEQAAAYINFELVS